MCHRIKPSSGGRPARSSGRASPRRQLSPLRATRNGDARGSGNAQQTLRGDGQTPGFRRVPAAATGDHRQAGRHDPHPATNPSRQTRSHRPIRVNEPGPFLAASTEPPPQRTLTPGGLRRRARASAPELPPSPTREPQRPAAQSTPRPPASIVGLVRRRRRPNPGPTDSPTDAPSAGAPNGDAAALSGAVAAAAAAAAAGASGAAMTTHTAAPAASRPHVAGAAAAAATAAAAAPGDAATDELGCSHFGRCSGCSLQQGLGGPPLYREAVEFFRGLGLQHVPAVMVVGGGRGAGWGTMGDVGP